MRRENVSDLIAFLAVARERSFTNAAAKLGVSQSALSHTIRGFEARLGLRLLANYAQRLAQPTPKKPQDLTEHNCINLRLPTHGGLYAWEFEKGKRELKVRVDGQLVFNTITQRLDAALAGLGLAFMPEDVAQPQSECLRTGARLFRVTTSTTRADGNPPRPLPCWSMRCAIGVNAAAPASKSSALIHPLFVGESKARIFEGPLGSRAAARVDK